MATKIADLFLRITAKNETGDVFNQIASQVDGKLVGSITRGVLQANLLTAGFSAIATQAQKAVGAIQSGIAEATNIQGEQVNAAATFAALSGTKYEQAVEIIENLNNRLAKSAMALPGATQEYKALATTIQDNVLEAFKGLNGEVDLQGYEDAVASISESFGALTANSTKNFGNTAMSLSSALGGASMSQLRTYMFFEQNAAILNDIGKRLEKLGASTLADLDIKARVKLLEDVGKKFITEDFKKAAGESVDGLMQSFKSMLFDPSSGIFGLMQDLDPAKGTQSAFTAYNDALNALIGEDGLLGMNGPLAAIASVLGIDKLAYLKTVQAAFQKATVGIEALSQFMFNIAGMLDQGVDMRQMIVENLGNIRTRIGDWLGRTLLSASAAVADAMGTAADFLGDQPIGEVLGSMVAGVLDALRRTNPFSRLFSQAGRLISAYLGEIAGFIAASDIGAAASDILDNLVSALGQVDWASLAFNFGQVLRETLIQIGRFLATIDYGALLSTAFSVLTGLVSGLFQGLFGEVNLQLPNINLSDLPAMIGRVLAGLINQIAGVLAGLDMTAMIGHLIDFGIRLLTLTTNALSKVNWAAIMPGLQLLIFLVLREAFKFIMAFLGGLDWGLILQAALNIGGGLLNMAFIGLFNALTKRLEGFRIVFTQWLSTTLTGALDNAEAFKDRVKSAIGNLFSKIRDKVLDMIPFVGNQSASTTPAGGQGGGFFQRLLGRADGQIPVAFGGLLGAIGQEMAAAPPGTRPVIANSGEFILRPSQAQAFAAGAAMGGGGSKVYNFNPTINLAAGTPESHAREVLRYFEIWLSEHQQASLA